MKIIQKFLQNIYINCNTCHCHFNEKISFVKFSIMFNVLIYEDLRIHVFVVCISVSFKKDYFYEISFFVINVSNDFEFEEITLKPVTQRGKVIQPLQFCV